MPSTSGWTFSQSLTATQSSKFSALNARRKFLELQSQQSCMESQQNNHHQDQQQHMMQYQHQYQHQYQPSNQASKLHIPRSVRCPGELTPISSNGDQVPFAEALLSVRNRCLPPIAAFSTQDFEWLDSDFQVNNSSGESSSRKVAAKESAKRDIDNYFFMYFRVRMENYIALVTAVKQSSKDESIFNEENLDRWTHKYKFKIRRSAPLKKALIAFSSRMGLEGDPDVMFCADGFYGDNFTGRTYNKNETPNNRVLPANTSIATGLRNGSSIFVCRINNQERNNAIVQLQLDLLKGNDPLDEDEDDAQAQSPDQTSDSKDAGGLGNK